MTVDGETRVTTIPTTFVSFGWEMFGMLGLQADMREPAFARAASYLAPAVIRVGGISADWVRCVRPFSFYDKFKANRAIASFIVSGI